jgi:hypothetical protein
MPQADRPASVTATISIHHPLEIALDTFPFGEMLMKAAIAAYCTLIALMLTAAIVVVSIHDMHASRLKALDNAYLAAP